MREELTVVCAGAVASSLVMVVVGLLILWLSK
jgi:hypothetical protein